MKDYFIVENICDNVSDQENSGNYKLI